MRTSRSPLSSPASTAACVAVVLAAALSLTAQEKGERPGAERKFVSAKESRAEYDRAVKPFFAKHCSACHGEKKVEGDLDLGRLDPDMKESASAARWVMLLEKLATREMPPESRPRPDDEALASVVRWIQAEMKRANKHLAHRRANANGNALAHRLLFDPKLSAPFDSPARVRLLRPEIYSLALDLNKYNTLGQPFSPAGGTTFRDMGAPRADEPVTAQLLSNTLAIVERQTAHKTDRGKVVPLPGSVKELVALMDEKSELTRKAIELAVTYEFDRVLARKPTEKELAKFVAFTEKNVKDAGRAQGVRYALAAVFLLPEAIFRFEVGDDKADSEGCVRLTPREIAFALAYALTDRRPDAALLADAEKGKLDTRDGVAAAVERMLDDSRLQKPRLLRFFREYFGYEAAKDVFKNDRDNSEHDARILVEDTDRLVEYVLEKDRNVLYELLTTNKSFVAYRTAAETKKKRAQELAKFEARKAREPEKLKNKKPPKVGRSVYEAYNLTDFPDSQPVELPKEQRAGILTQPAWLVAQSTSFDNHAIHRGKWVRERLLGGVIPDLPITVDAQLPEAPEKTLRERMKVTQNAYCWKCHQLMNDVGLPFEMFDHFGRFRTREVVLDPEATRKNVDKKGKSLGPVTREVPVDASGLIAHSGVEGLEGSTVTSAVAMLHKLATSEHVEQVFVRHAFRYWMGRNETLGDGPTLRAAHKAYRDSGGSMKALITSLLTSDAFLYRVPSKVSK